MQRTYLLRGLLAVSMLAAGIAGYGWWDTVHTARASVASSPVAQSAPLAGTMMSGLPDFSAIVSRYGPAVVNVSTVSDDRKSDQSGSGTEENDPMFKFFHHFGIPLPDGHGPRGLRRGLGSGFIISPDGLILTNAHVVQGARDVTVKLTDRREFRAKVVGMDKPSDVAVLRIKAENLPTVVMGDPDQVRVGAWVLAIGSPFGFDNSATAGIVSAKSRSLPDEGYVPFIQTDVAVNPGNSGGPLFDLRGEVIGINSQIYTRTGGYEGLSFAIPIDVALKVKDEILHNGKVTRGRMGVAIQDLNQSLAESFGLKSPAGALVSSVEHDSPAEKAGIKPGDVILSLNGVKVESSRDMPLRVADLKPGSKAVLGIWRNGAKHRLTVKVGELQQSTAMLDDEPPTKARLGLAVRPLKPSERLWAGVGNGLLVIDATGPAAQAGIEPGDVILAVNGTPVKSVDQLRAMTERAGRHVALLIQRDDTKLFVPLDLG